MVVNVGPLLILLSFIIILLQLVLLLLLLQLMLLWAMQDTGIATTMLLFLRDLGRCHVGCVNESGVFRQLQQ